MATAVMKCVLPKEPLIQNNTLNQYNQVKVLIEDNVPKIAYKQSVTLENTKVDEVPLETETHAPKKTPKKKEKNEAPKTS